MVAGSLAELHARKGDATLFIDEKGQPINGQSMGSPSPVEHDIMTGSMAEARCWPASRAAIGHRTRPPHSDRWVTPTALAPTATRPARCHRGIGTRKPELREHGSTRGRRAHLLLRAQLSNASRDARLSSQAHVMKLRATFIAFAIFGLQTSSVRAVVTQLTPAGFLVTLDTRMRAAPDRVYSALVGQVGEGGMPSTLLRRFQEPLH